MDVEALITEPVELSRLTVITSVLPALIEEEVGERATWVGDIAVTTMAAVAEIVPSVTEIVAGLSAALSPKYTVTLD